MKHTHKTFQYAGWSMNNGEWRLRFANYADRQKHLVKFGHEGLVMVDLPEPMTKRDAARYMFADTNLMTKAQWRTSDEHGEGTPLLALAEERGWYVEHWEETHN